MVGGDIRLQMMEPDACFVFLSSMCLWIWLSIFIVEHNVGDRLAQLPEPRLSPSVQVIITMKTLLCTSGCLHKISKGIFALLFTKTSVYLE